ncbi:MAG: type I glyceraldehyde-3-phosphate dehydrogenase [Microgenomates group bacterium]
MINVAINGFGRIGRVALRVILAKYLTKIKPVAINTSGSMDIEGWAHLFKYDSVYGQFKGKIKVRKEKLKTDKEIGVLEINNQKIPVLAEREPAKIPWREYDVDVVIEATGVFRDKKSASAHLEGGAKKVVISAPAAETKTFVMGVNEEKYRGELVINNASCTTNCIAPITKVIMEKFGIQKGLITTIHAYTADQELVDGSHKDLRRARAAAINIVPTTTGAAIATTEVLPSLKGLFDGLAIRVPVVCGSLADFTFVTVKRTTIEEVNKALLEASQGKYKGIIEASSEPLVSSDIIGNSASAIVDLSLTQVIDGDLVKIIAWYDNEWGYCCRLIDLIIQINNG